MPFNGEIYNFKKLTSLLKNDIGIPKLSDTKVLLELISKFKLNSHFKKYKACMQYLYLIKNNYLYLARDFFEEALILFSQQ